MHDLALEEQVINAVLSSAGFSPIASQKRPDDTDPLPVDANGKGEPPLSPDSLSEKIEALYQAAQAAQVYRDATGRLLSLEEIAQIVRNRASQATDPSPSGKQGSTDSELQADRTASAPPESLDELQEVPSPHSSVRKPELRG